MEKAQMDDAVDEHYVMFDQVWRGREKSIRRHRCNASSVGNKTDLTPNLDNYWLVWQG